MDVQVLLSINRVLSSQVHACLFFRLLTPSARTMISQTVEYALRAIVTIAQHAGQPCTSQKISEITQVPAPYLSKVMQGLVRADLVVSKRGLHGGFVLTKSALELTIWEVIDAVDPFKRIHECPLGIESHDGTLCPLHQRLDNAMASVEKSFRSTSVAELLAQPGKVTPLCEVPNSGVVGLEANLPESARKNSSSQKKKVSNKG